MLMCVWDTFFIFIWIFILYNGFIASPGWHWQGTVTPELRTQQPCCRNYCSSWLENLRIWVCFGSPAPPAPAVVRPVNISSLNPTLWLAGKNSLGIEAQCVRAFPAVYIFRCNKLPNKFLSLFSKCWSAARRDVNNLLFFEELFWFICSLWAAWGECRDLEDVGKRREIREN